MSYTLHPLLALSLFIAWLSNSPALLLLLLPLVTLYSATRHRPVFLIDHSCFKPGDAHKVSREVLMERFMLSGAFTDESLGFQRKMVERSGLGPDTYLPASLLTIPITPCMATAREEAETVVFGAVDGLLAKTGVPAGEIGMVVVNCSLYAPTPSLAEMIVNRYGLAEDVISYNFSGMGCSAGLISVDVAKQLLQVHPNKYALVVSTENMTLNGYFGNYRPMLVTNSIFRLGGAAVLLSNRPADRLVAKYQLLHTVRTHRGSNDRSYSCVRQEEDDKLYVGVALSKDLISVAGEALKANITALGPLVLPLSEKLLFMKTLILKKLLHVAVKSYIPDFKLAFEHFCIHAGGRAVLDQLEENLGLSGWHMEPSRATLYRFGNTSSSSPWYEMAYCEAKGRMKKGDRVWQIAFGSGFKCNSAVWRALRTVKVATKKINAWVEEDEIVEFEVSKFVSG